MDTRPWGRNANVLTGSERGAVQTVQEQMLLYLGARPCALAEVQLAHAAVQQRCSNLLAVSHAKETARFKLAVPCHFHW